MTISIQRYKRLLYILTSWAAIWAAPLQAQVSPSEPETDTSRVQIIYTDELSADGETKYLRSTSVLPCHLRQNDADIYFNRGTVFPNDVVAAADSFHIIQKDTIHILSDSAVYFGASRQADLFGDVKLTDGKAWLFTDAMHYDMNAKLGTYTNTGIITKDSAQLTSKRGYFYTDRNVIFFKDDVVVNHPDFSLEADTLEYNANTETVIFHGPTHIYQKDSSHIYCEAGFYDTRRQYAEFTKNAEYMSKSRHAVADKIVYDGKQNLYKLLGHAFYEDSTKSVRADDIYYDKNTKRYDFKGKPVFKDKKSAQQIDAEQSDFDEETGLARFRRNVVVRDSTQTLTTDSLDFNRKTHVGIARGHVVWQDTSAHTSVVCKYAEFNDSTSYLLATHRPLMSTVMDNDTLWLAADTLISFKNDPKDSTRNLIAYRDVRIYKSDLQGLCDSLSFVGKDSIFHFHTNPILWADTTQFTADTMTMTLFHKKIKQVNQYRNAFIVNAPDSLYFNQIKGNYIQTLFKNNQVQRMKVTGEGETTYYLQDEQKAYSGVNKTICANMMIYFGDNKVEKIKFYKNPQAVLYPMHQINHKSLRLEGFTWQKEARPKSVKDLFGPKRVRAKVSKVLSTKTTTE